jgi:hypothetical protein
MRSPSEHSGDIGLVVAAVWMMVAGAWIALAGGFSITLALVVAGALAIGAAVLVTSLDGHGR